MLRWRILIAVLVMTATVFGQQPRGRTGNDLLRQCNEMMKILDNSNPPPGVDAGEAMYCVGYVGGAADFATVGEVWNRVHDYKDAPFCVPVEAERGQLVRVVVRYMNDHPEELHKDKVVLVMGAFSAAFPCKQGADRK